MAPTRRVADEQRRTLIGPRHGLTRSTRASDPESVADLMVALHSSDPVTVYLSVLARCDADIETVSDALYRRRSLVRVHGMRRTLWVASRPVATAIAEASAKRLMGSEKRKLARFLEGAGITDDGQGWIDRANADVVAYLAEHGMADTRTIGLDLPHLAVDFEVSAGKKYAATLSAHTRVLLLLGFNGVIVRAEPLGTWIASQYRWALASHWLGSELVEDRSPEAVTSAQRIVIGRYLDAFGPVTETDIAWWTGWPVAAVRKALTALEAEAVELADGPGWVGAQFEISQGEAEPWVAVLPGLDPTTMGWKERRWYVDDEMSSKLFDRNGNAGPTIWVDGRVVGGWAQRHDGELAYRLFADVGSETRGRIDSALGRVADQVGDTRFKVRFPSPLATELRR